METQEKTDERVTVTEIVDDLKQKVFRGEYTPGDRLREADICSQYHVSRTPVREAFRLLQNEGILEYIPRCGVQVASLTLEELHQSQVIRGMLEGLSARLAASYMDEEGIEGLRRINQQIKEVEIYNELGELDAQFHGLIARYSHNPMLEDFIWQIHNRTGIIRYTLPYNKERTENSLKEHKDIIHALELHDEELAEKYTQIHFKMSLKALEEKMNDYLSQQKEAKKRRKRK